MKYDPNNAKHKLAKDFATAFIAYRMGVTFRTAQGYGKDEIGTLWLFLADLAIKCDNEVTSEFFKKYIDPEPASELEN